MLPLCCILSMLYLYFLALFYRSFHDINLSAIKCSEKNQKYFSCLESSIPIINTHIPPQCYILEPFTFFNKMDRNYSLGNSARKTARFLQRLHIFSYQKQKNEFHLSLHYRRSATLTLWVYFILSCYPHLHCFLKKLISKNTASKFEWKIYHGIETAFEWFTWSRVHHRCMSVQQWCTFAALLYTTQKVESNRCHLTWLDVRIILR